MTENQSSPPSSSAEPSNAERPKPPASGLPRKNPVAKPIPFFPVKDAKPISKILSGTTIFVTEEVSLTIKTEKGFGKGMTDTSSQGRRNGSCPKNIIDASRTKLTTLECLNSGELTECANILRNEFRIQEVFTGHCITASESFHLAQESPTDDIRRRRISIVSMRMSTITKEILRIAAKKGAEEIPTRRMLMLPLTTTTSGYTCSVH